MADPDSLQKGDEVLVRGRIEAVYPDELEITFDDWWPRWSAVLVKRARVVRLPAPPDGFIRR